jgi:HIRAN domain
MGIVAAILIALVIILTFRGLARSRRSLVVTGRIQFSDHHQVSLATAIASSGKSYPFSEISADPRFPHFRSIHTKIRGVTKPSSDGTNRQKTIRQLCQSGDALFLMREPTNPVDRNAIMIRRIIYSDVPDKPRLAEHLGYLSRDLAEKLAPKMDHDGFVLFAWIMEVSGTEDRGSLGVNIQIEEYRPEDYAPLTRKSRKRITS